MSEKEQFFVAVVSALMLPRAYGTTNETSLKQDCQAAANEAVDYAIALADELKRRGFKLPE